MKDKSGGRSKQPHPAPLLLVPPSLEQQDAHDAGEAQQKVLVVGLVDPLKNVRQSAAAKTERHNSKRLRDEELIAETDPMKSRRALIPSSLGTWLSAARQQAKGQPEWQRPESAHQ